MTFTDQDVTTSPGKNAFFFDRLESFSPAGGFVASGVIAKGKAGHVVRVNVTYVAERSSGGPDACPNASWLGVAVWGSVNGVIMYGEGRQSCPPDTYDCSASTTLWLDLDAAEADNPGQFKGKRLNIEIRGSDFSVPLGCKLLHSITGSAELVKKGKVKKGKR